jgi:putative phosphoribosyl transferase
MVSRFCNRTEAGQLLAQRLQSYTNCPDVLVLALPRGGVPVGFEIAKALNAPLDICIVRKLGVPGHKELAMGAIALGGARNINQDVVDWLHIPESAIESITNKERQELARRDQLYRGNRPLSELRDRTIILVDDGLATGSTMRAAIDTIQPQAPEYLIVAVPVAPASACEALQHSVNEVVCLLNPDPFYAIGLWYEDFSQTSDAEVRELLEQATNLPLARQAS